VLNLSDPSPALGWQGTERRSLAARDKPDLVLALALIHHLVIAANIPLPQVFDWLASLDCDLDIEWIDRDDPMVRRLLRPKTNDYDDYQRAHSEELLAARWEVCGRREIGRRVIFEAVRR